MKRKWDDENRFLCKVCNLWIANNKAQRDQHESGSKHKAAQANLIKEIAKKNALRQKENEADAPRGVNKQQHGASQLLEHAMKAMGNPLELNATGTVSINSETFRHDTQSVELPSQDGDHHPIGYSETHASANDRTNPSSTGVAHASSNDNDIANADGNNVDENDLEYPLPADEVLGEWVTVEEEEEVAKPMHSVNPSVRIGSTEEGDITVKDGDGIEAGQTDETSRPPVSFKRKLPNLSKRKRRRRS